MKINIKKVKFGPPLPPISLLLVLSYSNFHTICKVEIETPFVHLGLSFLYIYKYIYKRI